MSKSFLLVEEVDLSTDDISDTNKRYSEKSVFLPSSSAYYTASSTNTQPQLHISDRTNAAGSELSENSRTFIVEPSFTDNNIHSVAPSPGSSESGVYWTLLEPHEELLFPGNSRNGRVASLLSFSPNDYVDQVNDKYSTAFVATTSFPGKSEISFQSRSADSSRRDDIRTDDYTFSQRLNPSNVLQNVDLELNFSLTELPLVDSASAASSLHVLSVTPAIVGKSGDRTQNTNLEEELKPVCSDPLDETFSVDLNREPSTDYTESVISFTPKISLEISDFSVNESPLQPEDCSDSTNCSTFDVSDIGGSRSFLSSYNNEEGAVVSDKITENKSSCHLYQCALNYDYRSTHSNEVQEGNRIILDDIKDSNENFVTLNLVPTNSEPYEINKTSENNSYLSMSNSIQNSYTDVLPSSPSSYVKNITRYVSLNESFETLKNEIAPLSTAGIPITSGFVNITVTESLPLGVNNAGVTENKYEIIPTRIFLSPYETYEIESGATVTRNHETSFTSETSAKFQFTPTLSCSYNHSSCNYELPVFPTRREDKEQPTGLTTASQPVSGTACKELRNVTHISKSDMSTAMLASSSVSPDVSSVTIDSTLQTPTLDSMTDRNSYDDISFPNINMINSTVSSTLLEPSSTMTYRSIFQNSNASKAWNSKNTVDVTMSETSDYQSSSPSLLDVSSTSATSITTGYHMNDTSGPYMYPGQTLAPTAMSTTEARNVSAWSSPKDLSTTPGTNITHGTTPTQTVFNFSTIIIIASASAVVALVIFVIIALVCLKRKKRRRTSASKLQSDDLWVDLYRSNPTHHMPLPSLTSCLSAFEMTDAINQSCTESIKEVREKSLPEGTASPQVGQEKTQKVSSFQIKKANPEPERNLLSVYPATELEIPVGLHHVECWTNMSTSVSMTSLPTTELSYNTNVTDYNLAVVGHKFRVVYAYKPVCKGEMCLKEGELIVCRERDRNGWMYGSKPKTNEEGWFPAVYVDEISSDDELYFSSDIPETYDLLDSNKLHSVDQYWTGIEHKVCYRYESSVPGDLNLEPGEIVTVLQTLANGWWFAACGDRCGWFPGSYVEMTEAESSVPEQTSQNDISEKQHVHSSSNNEKQSTSQGNIATQKSEYKTDSEQTNVLHDSKFSENDQRNSTGLNEIVIVPESTCASLKSGSNLPQEDVDQLMESRPSSNTGMTTPTAAVVSKTQTGSTTNPTSSSSSNQESIHNDKKQGKLLRPARPAPPPPKQKGQKTRKESILDTNNETDVSRAMTTGQKKPVILIKGRRPKLQKVLRSQLDEKQLNPMIRPSTRGFIPKPTVNAGNDWKSSHSDNQGKTFNSVEHEQTNSSPSLADEFHGELITLLNESHKTQQTAGHISTSHTPNFRPLSQSNNDGSSSKTSLESGSDDKSASLSHIICSQQSWKENSQNKEQSHSKSFVNNISTRNLTSNSKRERSISPKLLTTSNLLQNVQRFQGAQRQTSPAPSLDGDKRPSSEKGSPMHTVTNTPPNTYNLSSHQQRTPTTVTPPRVPPLASDTDCYRQTGYSQQQQNLNDTGSSFKINSDLDRQSELQATPPITLPPSHSVSADRENIDIERRPSRLLRQESTAPIRDSLNVMPGTVSEIVHHINSLSPQ